MKSSETRYELGQGVRHTVNDYTKFNPNDNVKIFVRSRPLVETAASPQTPRPPPIIKPGEDEATTLVLRNPDPMRIVEDKFAFDRIFGERATQEHIFDEMARPLVQKVLEGYNGCIFAYGQTGSGKTYTMFGEQSEEQAGIVPRTAELVFRSLDSESNEVAVGCSFLEIYNERIRDIAALFSASGSEGAAAGAEAGAAPVDASGSLDRVFAEAREGMVPESEDFREVKARYDAMNLDVQRAPSGEVLVRGLTVLKVSSAVEVMKMLNYGLLLRETHGTSMNATSSRSHTVFTIRVIQRSRSSGVSVSAVLNLIDLAGSERLDDSKSTGQRLKEEIFINSSLTVLGKVISALDPSRKSSTHIPYRESKLTRVLQNSLSGNSFINVLANINPHPEWYFECVSTLEFVSRCRNVQNAPRVNYYDSAQDAANAWAGLGRWAAPEPAEALLLEPEHRLVAKGSKVFWRANAAVDFYLFEHVNSDIVELIGYNTGIFLEFEHIFLIKSVLFDLAAKEAARRQALRSKRAPPTHGHGPAHGGKPSQHGPPDRAQVFAHAHEHVHEHAHSDSAENVELIDKIAGEYVIDHIVYINGTAQRPPMIRFVNDLDPLPDGSEAPLVAEKPVDFLPIARPMNQRDRALLEAQQHGKTRDEISRLERQAAQYLEKAAALLHLDLDGHGERHEHHEHPSQKLKGMMDMEDTGSTEDESWATPRRRVNLSHLPQVQGEGQVQVEGGHHSHRGRHEERDPHQAAPQEEHLPDIAPSHKESEKHPHLFASPSGLIRDGHELHKVFKYYSSAKYGHEEMDVYEFKKMCREMNLTNAKFNTGTAEALFRKTVASAPLSEGEEAARREHRVRFGTFSALLKGVAHERMCLFDAVVNIVLNSFEQLNDATPH